MNSSRDRRIRWCHLAIIPGTAPLCLVSTEGSVSCLGTRNLVYIRTCGLRLAIKFTQLPHEGVAMEIFPTDLIVYRSAVYPQRRIFIYGLGGRLGFGNLNCNHFITTRSFYLLPRYLSEFSLYQTPSALPICLCFQLLKSCPWVNCLLV